MLFGRRGGQTVGIIGNGEIVIYQEAAYLLATPREKELHVAQNRWVLPAIADFFGCRLVNRAGEVRFLGPEEALGQIRQVLAEVFRALDTEGALSRQQLQMMMHLVADHRQEKLQDLHDDTVLVSRSGKVIRPKTLGQKEYVDAIRHHTVTLGMGPAGTGKTYLAVALAVYFFRNQNVKRIILTRPVVEAGERLGYLPGDLQDKVDPYLRPLYDALGDLFGLDVFTQLQTKGFIEVAPLAYMRGRTLEDAFIILDEAQNTTPEQMKMFLTRLGNHSKMVVNGDISQIDLPRKARNGLQDAVAIIGHLRDVATVELTAADVVRNDLVARIIQAYDRSDKEESIDGSHDRI